MDPPRLHRLLGDRSVHPRGDSGALHPPCHHCTAHPCDRHQGCSSTGVDGHTCGRRSGQSTCNIAPPLGEVNLRLRPTLLCLAEINTDLDQTQDELDVMGRAYLQLARENATLKQQLGGPDVEAPGVPAQSPPRTRGESGDPSTSTTVDPYP